MQSACMHLVAQLSCLGAEVADREERLYHQHLLEVLRVGLFEFKRRGCGSSPASLLVVYEAGIMSRLCVAWMALQAGSYGRGQDY